MKVNRKHQMLCAAIMIVMAGCVAAMAETIDVDVEVDADQAMKVEINTGDSTEVLTLDDLKEGEERVLKSGDHTVTVKRIGDDITVALDGEMLDIPNPGGERQIRKIITIEEGDEGAPKKMVMVTHDGEGEKGHPPCSHHGEKVKVVRIGADGDEPLVWHGKDLDEEILIELEQALEADGSEITVMVTEALDGELPPPPGKGHHVMKFRSGGHPHDVRFGKVQYRCDETGTVLFVDAEHATADTFVDPATGCELKKVEGDESQVIVIKEKVITRDENE